MAFYNSKLTAPIECVVNAGICNNTSTSSSFSVFKSNQISRNYGNNFHLNKCGPQNEPKLCGEECKSIINSSIVNGEVSGSDRGIVYCPFGINGENPPSIFPPATKSLIPQMDPRPLNKIGWEWRN